MVDIHSHILPQVDDGSSSPEETAKLLQLSRQQGVSLMVATPHFYADKDSPSHFLKRRQAALERFRVDPDTMPQLLVGAEVAYFKGMSGCEDLIPMAFGAARLLLVEMPFTPWSDRIVEDVLSLQRQLGVQPVLAHVERYSGADQFPRYMEKLLEGGVLFQCNAAAFLSFFGSKRYLRLLCDGAVHFLGSDCHNTSTRTPKLDQAEKVIAKKLGPEILEELDKFAYAQLLGE